MRILVNQLLFSHSVMSSSAILCDLLVTRCDSFVTSLQHARLSCSPPSPRACSNSYPLIQWCHPTISSSVIPFSSCLQSFPAWGSFLKSQFFASNDQSIGASASASVLPKNIELISFRTDWFDFLAVQPSVKCISQYVHIYSGTF